MTATSGPAGELLDRLSTVGARLERLAAVPPPGGLTDPDQPSGERWEWGQVWAHLAEFIPYWIEQVGLVLEGTDGEPVPFGRIKTDTRRIEAIERDRARPVSELWTRVAGHMDELRALIEDLPERGWTRRGEHPTLGVMDVPRILDSFLVGHLEEHAHQLDELAADRGA